jgi:hypothetical protein
MPSFNFNPFPLPILFLFMLSFLPLTTHVAGTATYLYHVCPNTSSTDDSGYLSNLRSLLSSFSLYAARNFEFYSLTYPTASLSSNANSKIQISVNISNPVHGLYSCRGDISADECRDCVASAAEDLAERCPKEKDAVGWYEWCMLRYSNRYFFSSMVTDPGIYMSNTINISEPSRFDQLVRTMMNDVASGVSKVGSAAKKFGTKEANFTALQTLYTLGQCTPDLSGSDCNSCLQRAIASLPGCCGGKNGGRVLFPSCNVRFEVYPFYSEMVAAAPSPTPGLPTPPPSSVTGPKGKWSTHLNLTAFHFILFFIYY